MRIVLQRVSHAQVEINNKTVGQISNGLLLLIGIGKGDSEVQADKLVDKIIKLRIFEDEQGKMNKNIVDAGGSILVVSQFTLYGNCWDGNRPGFELAAPPDEAKRLYEYFVEKLKQTGIHVETGQFATYMHVSLINDGPVTFVLES
ncbi:MAG TPA: D-tyrosyl-tRNA(Tyr) deacylase [Candidatus Magasanikbacteria bacterium]|nr:MAG: D-tyrosyl-tRNA(Tyr) deacylase [Candidatus Magasanikbacteria bacterium RIFOXYC2_FULL_39_8]HAT03784.1 D-tyrosyl-tRNA(Tyr) deacylase [Candidatus Magasanikbacteria bacterium]